MIKRMEVLWICMVLILAVGTARAADPSSTGPIYSLSELYQIALDNAEQIQISKQELEIARQQWRQSLARLIPDLSTFGSHTRYSEEKSAGGQLLQPEWSSNWGVRLEQSLTLNGREFVALRLSGKAIQKQKTDLDATIEGYLFEVASAYYDVLRLMKGLDIAVANVKRLEKHREAVSARLAVEAVTKTDMYRAEAELSQAQSDRVRMENDLRLAKAVLARLAGLPEIYRIRDPGPESDFSFSGDPAALKQIALENRAEIKSLKTQRELLTDRIRIARGDFWPTLTASGSYQQHEQSSDLEGTTDEDSLSVRLEFNFPLFEGGGRLANVRENLAARRQVELSLADQSKTIQVEVEQAYLELMTHQSVIRSQTDQLRFARENYKSVTLQFRYGISNSVDVMDANTLLVSSQRQLAESQYNYQLSRIQMKRAIGVFLSQLRQRGLEETKQAADPLAAPQTEAEPSANPDIELSPIRVVEGG